MMGAAYTADRYFYPRPPRGGRPLADLGCTITSEFLSTPSARRATASRSSSTRTATFLSTPSARRATSGSIRSSIWQPNFYPRPPRGGRHAGSIDIEVTAVISIHALREEGDVVSAAALSKFCKFLSTPSARRATAELSESYTAKVFLSTPSARRATVTPPADRDEGWKFLSTPSARRATHPRC